MGYWEHYGCGFNFQSFFEKVPTDLRKWFLELFIYAHATPVASQLVEQILSLKSGPFSDDAFLVSDSGTCFLNYLAEADPSATIKLLESTYGQWPLEKLRGWETGRQNIVRAPNQNGYYILNWLSADIILMRKLKAMLSVILIR